MLRESDFDRPFDSLEPSKLLGWARLCGRQRLDATSRFLATLPALEQSGAYRATGAQTICQFAALEGGLSKREVDDLFRVYERIGRHWGLWRLMALAKVRLWKLALISRFVTDENAKWWAKKVQICTRAQLEAYITAIKGGRRPWDAKGTGGVAEKVASSSNSQVSKGGSDKADRTADPDIQVPPAASVALGEEALEADPGATGPVTPPGGTERVVGEAAPPNDLTDNEATGRPDDRSADTEAQSRPDRHGAEEPMLEAANSMSLRSTMMFIAPVSVRIEISPLAEKILRELQAACVAAEGPTSLGQVVERLIFEAARLESLPGRGVQSHVTQVPTVAGTVEPRSSGDSGLMEASPDSENRVGMVRPESGAGRGRGLAGPTASGYGEEHLVESEDAACEGPGPDIAGVSPTRSEASAVTMPEAAGPRAGNPKTALPRKQVIEVVYFSADTDRRWLPSKLGPIPLEAVPSALKANYTPARSITLHELHARAVVACRKHAKRLSRRLKAKRRAGIEVAEDDGRQVPRAIELYLQARSGGYCERTGCHSVGVLYHHLDPFSVSRRHDPDRMLMLCKACHDAFHSDLFVPDVEDPRTLLPIGPGVEAPQNPVNAGVLAAKALWRQRAVSGLAGPGDVSEAS